MIIILKIPETIEIAGITYKIQIKYPDAPELDYGTCKGSQINSKALITLRNDMEGDIKNQCFIHELVHAILDALAISHTTVTIDERFADSFSQLLYQVIKQLTDEKGE